MTPKEKALHLLREFDKIDDYYSGFNHNSLKCALICVDEILEMCERDEMVLKYWNEVKSELEKL